MDEAIAIILISVAMFLGCFLLGLIPLQMKLSEKSLQFVSVFGAGLLCGTALAIVLPEGVELLEESWRVSSCSVAPAAANQNASDVGVRQQLQEEDPPSKGLPARFFIGVSLVVGFILMFLVDQISSYCSGHDPRTGMSNRTSITATLGLVIHAAADGVALGTHVAFSPRSQFTAHWDWLSILLLPGQLSSPRSFCRVVFLAVILRLRVHCVSDLLLEAPTAFGLVTFLMQAGVEKKQIQKHLLVFSAAAPVLSIGTYFILNASGGSPQNRLSATGVGMLFSAGTFLYVATVHVLPEISTRGQQSSPHLHGTGSGQLEVLESLTLILGAGLPVLLALGLRDD
ncbi:zinc transporter ZIP9-like [Oncorhynchus keta]|uniref:zinc transporter ZIP9-like n=1 Tax=Oncorhynchus keta TaxID=8018 RepID=UPI00227B9673|nr:zinc transporter ZIP9-like [Oncorhynchus keta]